MRPSRTDQISRLSARRYPVTGTVTYFAGKKSPEETVLRPGSYSLQIVELGIQPQAGGSLGLGECALVKEGQPRRPRCHPGLCLEKRPSLGVPRKQVVWP